MTNVIKEDLGSVSFDFSGKIEGIEKKKIQEAGNYSPNYYLNIKLDFEFHRYSSYMVTHQLIKVQVPECVYEKVENLLSEAKTKFQNPVLKVKSGRLEIIADGICIH